MRRLLCAAALALLAAPLAGQARPLSLAEARRLAEENNPALRRADADLLRARADERRATGQLLPDLSFNLSSRVSLSRTYSATGDFGEVRDREQAFRQTSSSLSQGVAADVTLFDGGVNRRELRAARQATGGVASAREAEALRVRAEVARRYWRAVLADRTVQLEERILASAREQLDATRRQVAVAVRTPGDVLGAEVQVANQERALSRARADARKARLELQEPLGVFWDDSVRLTDAPPEPFDPSGLEPAALVRRAMESHPRLARVAAGERAAELRVDAARAGWLPRLSLRVDGGLSEGTDGLRGAYDVAPRNQSASVSLGVSLPLFDRFQRSAAVQTARAGRVQAAEDARAERLAVEREVRSALIDLVNAFDAFRTAERAERVARERLDMAQEQYLVGALTYLELRQAIDDANRAERDALATRFEFAAAAATLEERVGGGVAGGVTGEVGG